MENSGIGTKFIIYFILFLGLGLLVLQILDAKKVYDSYDSFKNYRTSYVDNCLKFPLISQSIMLGIQIIVCFFLINFSILMLVGLSPWTTSLSMLNYKLILYTLGPLTLGFSILGFVYWDEVVFSCNPARIEEKNLNIFNCFSIVIQFIFSLLVTLCISVFEVLFLEIDSLLRRPEGSDSIRKLFWYFASKYRENPFLHHRNENEETDRNRENENENENNENNQNQNNESSIKVDNELNEDNNKE